MVTDKISSLDRGYQTGDLSIFPEALDDRDILYEATNNSWVPLKQTLSAVGKMVIVESTAGFPDKGIIRVGPPPGESGQYEMIYYNKRTGTTFQQLKRGFAGSLQSHWYIGNYVSNSVAAEHHNAIKDAVINMEKDLGKRENPEPASLNGILKAQETRFLAPKPLFRAFPIKGPSPMKVRFQNFTTGYVLRYLWDFGDGGTSLEKSPTHTYLTEGSYTVKLNIITSLAAQGICTKTNYIQVNNDESQPFFYVDSLDNPYSAQTATEEGETAKEFVFIDQSDGDIVQRNWDFGDGNTHTELDPDIHSIGHIYQMPGEYFVTELIQFSNGRLKRIQLPDPILVV